MINSQIRVPEDIWEKLKKISENEERSLNSQIIYILKKFVEDYENSNDIKEKN